MQTGARVIVREIEPRLVVGRERFAGEMTRAPVEWIERAGFGEQRGSVGCATEPAECDHREVARAKIVRVDATDAFEPLERARPVAAGAVQLGQREPAGGLPGL